MELSNARLEGIAAAMFVIMCGVLWLVPGGVPPSFWVIGASLILLGLNVARYMIRLPLSEITISAGLVLLLGGLVDYTGGPWPVLPIFVIIVGLWLLARNLLRLPRKRQE